MLLCDFARPFCLFSCLCCLTMGTNFAVIEETRAEKMRQREDPERERVNSMSAFD